MVSSDARALSEFSIMSLRSLGISDLTFEWIVRGEKLKMKASNKPEQDLVLPDVANDILATTKRLDPKKGSKFFISTKDYADEQWGPWVLKNPPTYAEDAAQAGVQVTTGLPMEGTYCPIPAHIFLVCLVRSFSSLGRCDPHAKYCRSFQMYFYDLLTNCIGTHSHPGTHLNPGTRSP